MSPAEHMLASAARPAQHFAPRPVRPSSGASSPISRPQSRLAEIMDSPVKLGGQHMQRGGTVSPTDSFSSFTSGSSFSFHNREQQWLSLLPVGHGGGARLRRACKEGELAEAQRLINVGASVHSYDEAFERTPLHFAAQHGHLECCELLFRYGASVDCIDVSSHQPLHLAAERGHCDVCEWLCTEAGVDVCARSPNGSMALHYAAHNNHTELACVLLELMLENDHELRRGAKAFDRWRNNYGQSPLDLARVKGHARLADMLERVVEPPPELRRLDL